MMAKQQRLAVRAWSAWSPERETSGAWLAWAGAPREETDVADVAPMGDAVPMMLRRRTTGLGRKMIGGALACGETARTGRYVLASRHGEFSRILGILKCLAARELPSPAEFSMSVHNALPGLLSIHTGNTHGHTAVAAGLDTFGFGLMEAAACLAERPYEPVLYFFGDEPLPGEFNTFGKDDIDLPLVIALALRTPNADEEGIVFDAVPRSAGSPPSTAAAIDFLRFLLSGEESAVSEGMRMTWIWRRDV